MTFILILSQVSCGTRFDLHGVDRDQKLQEQQVAREAAGGCMKDADCTGGKVCATVRGEYPGSCADEGHAGELLGAIAVGAMAAAAVAASQNNQGGGGGGGTTNRSSYVPGQSSAGDCPSGRGYIRSCPDDTKANNYGRPSANSTGLYDRDIDGDGIYNQFDNDNDNDGILDDYDTQ